MSLKRPKIKVLVSNDLSTDQRVHKVCTYLASQGYEVELIGRKRSNSLKLQSRPYACKRFTLPFTTGPLFYASLNIRFFFFLLFHKTNWILANDLDTLPAAYLAKKLKRNCALVYDTHEYYTGVPELISRPKIRAIWLKIESFIFPKLDKIYTVNDSISALYKKEYGKDLIVVRNVSPKINLVELTEPKELSGVKNKKIIIFQGAGINIDRGAEEAVEAMKGVEGAVLLFVGHGDVIEMLKLRVAEQGLCEKVIFIGKRPYLDMMAFTKLAYIGLSLDKNTNPNYENSLPNKIFDYLQANVPIIATRIKEVAKIVEQHELGEVIDTLSAESLTEAINKLLENEDLWNTYRANCIKASEVLCWENETSQLDKIYK
jgi:glycosyltransferase involved in cell wall biosynthesis